MFQPLMNFVAFCFYFKAVQITPLTSNDSNTTLYSSVTFNLNTGSINGSETLVTLPPESIAEIARISETEAPVIHVTVIGEDFGLSCGQSTSQVIFIRIFNAKKPKAYLK